MNMNKSKKEALLQAAKELFGECGYVETTFKKISDRAGVALGLLTHHYGNKEKLFLASGLDVLEHFLTHAKENHFTVLGITYSPIRGPEGNIEFLMHVRKCVQPEGLPQRTIEAVVSKAHESL